MKIILFGDAPMAVNEGGICQTLYNLFSFIEPECFLGITSFEKNDFYKIGDKYSKRYLNYKHTWLKTPRNRIGKLLSPYITWINYSICQLKSYEDLKKEISSFNPDIIISCSCTSIGILMHAKLFKGKEFKGKIIPYFMDDWMYQSKQTWLNGNLQELIKKMLSKNDRWMMIGKELSEILEERYQIKPKEVLYIRNPVDLPSEEVKIVYKRKKQFKITYAGALWPMHYDAFLLFAKAVNLLSGKQNITLILYSPQSFWNFRGKELESLNVIYGGHIPYTDLNERLVDADALLITSSFNPDYFTHSKASLQTKITDYSKAGRLIISCGPVYSANNNFIKEKDCGICIETQDINEICNCINDIAKNILAYQYKVENAFESLKDFTKENVHRKIQEFLKDTIEAVESSSTHIH